MPVPVQAPDQPVNTDPAAGVALSVTAVSNWALQLPLGAPAAIELVFDDIQQSPMQALYERQGIEIERPDMVELRLTIGGLDRFHYGLHSDAFHLVFVLDNGPCFPVDARNHTDGP